MTFTKGDVVKTQVIFFQSHNGSLCHRALSHILFQMGMKLLSNETLAMDLLTCTPAHDSRRAGTTQRACVRHRREIPETRQSKRPTEGEHGTRAQQEVVLSNF